MPAFTSVSEGRSDEVTNETARAILILLAIVQIFLEPHEVFVTRLLPGFLRNCGAGLLKLNSSPMK